MSFLDPELEKLQEELFAEDKEAGPDISDTSAPSDTSDIEDGSDTDDPGPYNDPDPEDEELSEDFGESAEDDIFSDIELTEPMAPEVENTGSDRFSLALDKRRLSLILGGAVLLIMVIVLIARGISAKGGGKSSLASASTPLETEAPSTESEEELREKELQNTIDNELGTYDTLGIADVTGYINVRSGPNTLDMTNIIGQLQGGAACDVISEEGDWYYISSGGISGYVSKQYIVMGDEALELATEGFADRAIITTEVLNIRSEPNIDPENIIGKARYFERYEVLAIEDDWARIKADFRDDYEEAYINIGDGNAVVRYCLNEARRLDLRELALTQYDVLVVSNTTDYVNIRETPEDLGIDNICGQFPSHAGAELLETVENDGRTWYRIRSGDVTGYVSAEYCVTGEAARQLALEAAQLTAYITTDTLNVRSEPSLDATVWTQVTRNQSYHVIDQLDGWVEIELDSSDDGGDADRAFISTRDNNVEVTYGLPTAIEYYPAVEAANAAMAFRNQIVNYAVQFVGNPYVWGGTSLTNGADCSGFVQSVLKHFGISVPRTSREQARSGVSVSSSDMRPGDLVFYANSSGTVNHVAMYIGNGQVVNAASSRSGITIYRWNYRTPVAIRNVIGD